MIEILFFISYLPMKLIYLFLSFILMYSFFKYKILLFKNRLLISFVFSAFIFSNNAYSFNDLESGSRLINRLEKMEKDLNTLQRQFYRNKGSAFSNLAAEEKVMPSSIASIDARMGNIEEQIRGLNGQIELLQHEVNRFKNLINDYTKINDANTSSNTSSLNNLNKQVNPVELKEQTNAVIKDQTKILGQVKIGKKESGAIKEKELPHLEKKKEIQNLIPQKKQENVEEVKISSIQDKEPLNEEAQELYDKSFSYLRASKWNEAERGFNSFIEKYSDHKLIGNAYYWLGETYFERKNYKQAGANFLRGYNKNPNGSKANESLLKTAVSFFKLDKKKEACAVIGKLNSLKLSPAMSKKIKNEEEKIGCK